MGTTSTFSAIPILFSHDYTYPLALASCLKVALCVCCLLSRSRFGVPGYSVVDSLRVCNHNKLAWQKAVDGTPAARVRNPVWGNVRPIDQRKESPRRRTKGPAQESEQIIVAVGKLRMDSRSFDFNTGAIQTTIKTNLFVRLDRLFLSVYHLLADAVLKKTFNLRMYMAYNIRTVIVWTAFRPTSSVPVTQLQSKHVVGWSSLRPSSWESYSGSQHLLWLSILDNNK